MSTSTTPSPIGNASDDDALIERLKSDLYRLRDSQIAYEETTVLVPSRYLADVLIGGWAILEELPARISSLKEENERLRAELERRDRNENRNCLNWGPCSQHDERMAETGQVDWPNQALSTPKVAASKPPSP